MRWFKLYGEKWFLGSTRWELTLEQRAIWIDILARASLNEPPGQIDFYSLEQLAHQFNVDKELLLKAINRLIEVKKIKFYPNRKKIVILNWKKYQSEYERQKPYRKGNKEDISSSNVEKMSVKSYNKVTLRGEGEEKRIEENNKKRGKTSISESNINSNSFPFKDNNEENKWLALLKDLNGYPFDENADRSLYRKIKQKHPNVDRLKKLKKKIDWWKENPGALSRNPRKQLIEWFRTDFNSGDLSILDSLNPDERGFQILNSILINKQWNRK